MWLLKLLQVSCFALNSENLTVDNFLRHLGNAPCLRRGRSGIADRRAGKIGWEWNGELVTPSLLQRSEHIFPARGLWDAPSVMPQPEARMGAFVVVSILCWVAGPGEGEGQGFASQRLGLRWGAVRAGRVAWPDHAQSRRSVIAGAVVGCS